MVVIIQPLSWILLYKVVQVVYMNNDGSETQESENSLTPPTIEPAM